MKDNDFLKPGDSVSTNKQLMDSPELEEIATNVIEEEGLDFGPARIGYLLVYPNLSKYRAGKAKKASKEEKHVSGNDYWIQFSGDIWDMLDSKTRHKAVYHLLLNLDPTYKAKNQEWKMKTRKPDFADFYEINDKYGNDWYKTVQSVTSSLYDLNPKKECKVSF